MQHHGATGQDHEANKHGARDGQQEDKDCSRTMDEQNHLPWVQLYVSCGQVIFTGT